MKKKVFRYAGFALIVILMVAGRVLVGGFHEDAKAREALAQGDVTEAITAYDRSLHWYLPGSPTVARAARGLKGIAGDAEGRADPETALRAWRVLRSGMYASRWLFTPGKNVIAECDGNIARLVADKAAKINPEKRQAAFDRETAVLKQRVGPSVGWSLAAIAGFFGWIASVILFIIRAFGPGEEFHRRAALILGAAFVLSYALWMIALSKA